MSVAQRYSLYVTESASVVDEVECCIVAIGNSSNASDFLLFLTAIGVRIFYYFFDYFFSIVICYCFE